jgi:integrase
MPRTPKPTWPPIPKRPHGTGSLSRLPDGRIRARLPRSVDPKRQAREFPPDALAEANAWLDARIRGAEEGSGEILFTGASSVLDWTGHWWETFVQAARSPNTAHKYLWALQQLAPRYGVAIQDVKRSHLQAVVNGVAKRVAPATVDAMIGVWRRCFQAAVDDDLIPKNPVIRLTHEAGAVESTEPRRLTAKELGLLRAAIVGERFEPAFCMMLEMGMRIAEILGLHWRNVDFAGHRIWIADQYTNNHWRRLPKGKNPHWKPMPPGVERVLIRHRDRQSPGCELVLQSPHRGRRSKHHDRPMPWSQSTIRNDLAAIVKRLGLDGVTPHAGRHGLASHWIAAGVSPAEVARRLGHADPGITFKRYVHPTEQSSDLADRLVEALFSGHLGDHVGGSKDGPSESDG